MSRPWARTVPTVPPRKQPSKSTISTGLWVTTTATTPAAVRMKAPTSKTPMDDGPGLSARSWSGSMRARGSRGGAVLARLRVAAHVLWAWSGIGRASASRELQQRRAAPTQAVSSPPSSWASTGRWLTTGSPKFGEWPGPLRLRWRHLDAIGHPSRRERIRAPHAVPGRRLHESSLRRQPRSGGASAGLAARAGHAGHRLENNLSETAFFVALGPGRFHLRWFTPVEEVALCGHATLATSHVIFTHIGVERDAIVFDSPERGRSR